MTKPDTPTPAASGAAPAEDGYTKAFYEIASVLGIGARADTPENVFRNEMLPRIVALACREASPATLTDEQIIKAVSPHLFFNDSPDGDNSTDDVLKAARALLALASPQVAPAVTREQVIDWLDGEDIGVTNKQMDRLFATPVQVAPTATPTAEARGMTEAQINELRAVTAHFAGDWPDVPTDHVIVSRVKWAARELTKLTRIYRKLETLKGKVCACWITGAAGFQKHYDKELLDLFGVATFQDLYQKSGRTGLGIIAPSPAAAEPQDKHPRCIIWDSTHPDYPVEWSNPGRATREGQVYYIRYDLFSAALEAAPVAPQDDARDAAEEALMVNPGPWRIGLFRSSAYRDKLVRMVSEGEKEIAEHAAHKDFVRWITPTDSSLIQALREAEAGLEVAVARMPQTTDFVPCHVAAVKIVREALALSTPAAKPTEPTLPTQGEQSHD